LDLYLACKFNNANLTVTCAVSLNASSELFLSHVVITICYNNNLLLLELSFVGITTTQINAILIH